MGLLSRLRARLPELEVIGPEECPIIHRWTLAEFGRRVDEGSGPSRQFKLILHRFMPKVDERDFHDHPRSFVTFVLRGGYDDLTPTTVLASGNGGKSGVPIPATAVDRLRAPALRFRPATHRHRTRVHPGGAWTLVIMGPIKRPWGFWPDGRFMPHRAYRELHGAGMECA